MTDEAVQMVMRITPARAGKSPTTAGSPQRHRDHPRMRGEECVSMLYAMADQGSPPHARGREMASSRNSPPERITPACAGKR